MTEISLCSSAQDQVIIQRLKERIAQLDVENSLLTKATAASMGEDGSHLTGEDQDENHPDLESLMKHISKLKVAIRQAHERFGKSLTVEGSRRVPEPSSHCSSRNPQHRT